MNKKTTKKLNPINPLEINYHCSIKELSNGDYEFFYPKYFNKYIRFLRNTAKVLGPTMIAGGLIADAFFTISAISGTKPPDGSLEAGLLSMFMGFVIYVTIQTTKRKLILVKPGLGMTIEGGYLDLKKITNSGFEMQGDMAICWVNTIDGQKVAVSVCDSLEAANEVHTFLQSNMGKN